MLATLDASEELELATVVAVGVVLVELGMPFVVSVLE